MANLVGIKFCDNKGKKEQLIFVNTDRILEVYEEENEGGIVLTFIVMRDHEDKPKIYFSREKPGKIAESVNTQLVYNTRAFGGISVQI